MPACWAHSILVAVLSTPHRSSQIRSVEARTSFLRSNTSCCHAHALQLAESQARCQQLQSNLDELKSDFQYNLQLLAERDAELEAADAAAAAAAAEMASKASNITQLQAQLAQASSGERMLTEGLRMGVCKQSACVLFLQ